jgi:hypothetical protein
MDTPETKKLRGFINVGQLEIAFTLALSLSSEEEKNKYLWIIFWIYYESNELARAQVIAEAMPRDEMMNAFKKIFDGYFDKKKYSSAEKIAPFLHQADADACNDKLRQAYLKIGDIDNAVIIANRTGKKLNINELSECRDFCIDHGYIEETHRLFHLLDYEMSEDDAELLISNCLHKCSSARIKKISKYFDRKLSNAEVVTAFNSSLKRESLHDADFFAYIMSGNERLKSLEKLLEEYIQAGSFDLASGIAHSLDRSLNSIELNSLLQSSLDKGKSVAALKVSELQNQPLDELTIKEVLRKNIAENDLYGFPYDIQFVSDPLRFLSVQLAIDVYLEMDMLDKGKDLLDSLPVGQSKIAMAKIFDKCMANGDIKNARDAAKYITGL